jgi:hypothetical protein
LDVYIPRFSVALHALHLQVPSSHTPPLIIINPCKPYLSASATAPHPLTSSGAFIAYTATDLPLCCLLPFAISSSPTAICYNSAHIQYKYVVRNSDGSVVRWQEGDNVSLELPGGPAEALALDVEDSWNKSKQVGF